MFEIGASELLLIAVVAIVVIGPKDMPMALRAAGRWIAKVRRVSGHFRSGIETMIREAELEEMEREWRRQNEEIMKAHPSADPYATHPQSPDPASAEGALARLPTPDEPVQSPDAEPPRQDDQRPLPLTPP